MFFNRKTRRTASDETQPIDIRGYKKHSEKENQTLREVLQCLSYDMERYCHRLEINKVQAVLLTPGFQALMMYRFSHWLLPITRKKTGFNAILALILALLRRFTEIITGIYISPEAVIGEGLLMIHFGGIVVGPSVIGRNCEIFQGVTLGVNKSLELGVPTLGDRVYLGPGAKVLGNIKLGNDVCVGPNSVLLNSVPDRAVVIGIPGRIMGKNGSFDLVIYPDMESDLDRKRSMAQLATSHEEQDKPARPSVSDATQMVS